MEQHLSIGIHVEYKLILAVLIDSEQMMKVFVVETFALSACAQLYFNAQQLLTKRYRPIPWLTYGSLSHRCTIKVNSVAARQMQFLQHLVWISNGKDSTTSSLRGCFFTTIPGK